MTNRELMAQVELGNARRVYMRAEREAKRENKPLPKALQAKHMEAIRLAQRNLNGAQVSAAAMNAYPPIR